MPSIEIASPWKHRLIFKTLNSDHMDDKSSICGHRFNIKGILDPLGSDPRYDSCYGIFMCMPLACVSRVVQALVG